MSAVSLVWTVGIEVAEADFATVKLRVFYIQTTATPNTQQPFPCLPPTRRTHVGHGVTPFRRHHVITLPSNVPG